MIHQLAAAALLLAQAAPAAEQRCLTREQAADLAVTALPIATDTLIRHCRTHVPATAFINTGGAELVARMRAAAEGRQQSALVGISAMSGGEMPGGVSPEVAMAGASAMIGAALTANLRPEACADANALIEALAPLPPENVGRIVGAVLGLVTASRSPAADGEAQAAQRGPLCEE